MTFFEQRRTRFIIISVFMLLLFGLLYSQWQDSRQSENSSNIASANRNQNTNQTPNQITEEFSIQAQAALDKGTVIQDGKDDWVTTGYKGDNPGFYEASWIDIKSVTVGVDDEFFYLKWDFSGQIPGPKQDWPSYNGDQLKGAGFNIIVDIDNKQGVGGDTKLFGEVAIYGYVNPPGQENTFGVGFWTNPVSRPDIPADEAYENQYDSIYKWGGPGYNYVVVAAPLDVVGITKDRTVTLNIWAEAESEQYHHATFDAINLEDPAEDDASKIRVELGASEIIEQ